MADSKITALTSISTSTDPANDPLVIVDVSDTSMAATGTTKKVTLNQLLGASGTATLASATITGDLTVDTSTLKVDSANNRVGVLTASPAQALDVASGNLQVRTGGTIYSDTFSNYGAALQINAAGSLPLRLQIGGSNAYEITSANVHTWSNVGGVAGTAMTLNATGLGVGASPSYQLHVSKSQASATTLFIDNQQNNAAASSDLWLSAYGGSWKLSVPHSATFVNPLIFKFGSTEMMRLDASGNVGIGITPSAWATSTTIWRALDLQYSCGLASSGAGSGEIDLLWNAYYDQTDQRWEFKYTGDRASRYAIGGSGVHAWYNTASTGTANGAITWTQAMALDASGNLLVRCTTAGAEQLGFQVIGYTNGNYVRINHNASAASGDSYLNFFYNATQIGSITQNGTTGVLYNIISDYRLKESVQPLVGGLARVNALKPSVYKWKSDGSNGEGFLAHELAEVVPFAVSGEKDAVNEDGSIKSQGIDMSRVVPILVAAIQELTARVQTLETR